MSVEGFRVRFAPPITANELLSRRLHDGKELALTKSPIHLFKVEKPGIGSLEYGGIIQYQLDGYTFWRFVNTIAPIPYATDLQGVLDDWRMPDMESSNRLKRHQRSLREDWDIFERSRQILTDTVRFDPRLQGQRTAERFRIFMNRSYQTAALFAKSMIESASPKELQEAFVDFLKDRDGFRNRKWFQHRESVDTVRQKVSDTWQFMDSAQSFLAATLGKDSPSLKELIIERYNNGHNSQEATLGLVDGKVIVRIGNLLRGEIIFTPNQRGNKLWELPKETFVSTNYLVPTLHWAKNGEGERKWLLDFLEEPLIAHIQQFLDAPPDGLLFDNRRLNPMIGLATIPYFIPKLRAGWPKYQAMHGAKTVPVEEKQGGNFMGPAQVLVLALQRKKDSLASEYFDAAEAYIEKHAA